MSLKDSTPLALSVAIHVGLAVVLLWGDFSTPPKPTPSAVQIERRALRRGVGHLTFPWEERPEEQSTAEVDARPGGGELLDASGGGDGGDST